MKRRQDCDCPCHLGGAAVHVVPCCEGMLSSLFKRGKLPSRNTRHSKTGSASRKQHDKY